MPGGTSCAAGGALLSDLLLRGPSCTNTLSLNPYTYPCPPRPSTPTPRPATPRHAGGRPTGTSRRGGRGGQQPQLSARQQQQQQQQQQPGPSTRQPGGGVAAAATANPVTNGLLCGHRSGPEAVCDLPGWPSGGGHHARRECARLPEPYLPPAPAPGLPLPHLQAASRELGSRARAGGCAGLALGREALHAAVAAGAASPLHGCTAWLYCITLHGCTASVRTADAYGTSSCPCFKQSPPLAQ